MIMLSIAKTKIRSLAFFGALLAAFVASNLIGHISYAADDTQPTYTLSYESQISAKGGFISNPNVTSNPMFTGSGSSWELAEPKDDYNKNYYNESTAEIYFKYERGPDLYITHTQYAIPGGIASTSEHGPCDVAIKTSSTTGGAFVGVERNDDPKKQVEDAACTKAVLDQLTLGSNKVAFGNIAEPTGETLMGVTIETCKKGSSDYAACVSRRNDQIKQADAAIVCTTTSPDNIERCNYYKSIIGCLKTTPSISVATCTTRADATRILNGSYSLITAETTDAYINRVCGALTNPKRQQCIDKATKQRDKLAAAKKECEKNGGTWDNSTGRCTESEKSTTSCAVDGVGWMVCPVMTFLGEMTDFAFNFLASSFLETDAAYIETGGPAYNAWAIMRNFANVAFVIAFLVIIYAQITGMGLTNYGIKKLLPKIIIAAILVNVSFFICQFAVDISNIAGYSIKSLFDSLGGLIQTGNTYTDTTRNPIQTGALILAIIAAGISLALAISIPLILAVLLALVLILFILMARTALIILLIVISPLAFVAYLLPNTEQWFQKWRKMFINLLLLFPIIATVFGASSLAAQIVKDAAEKSGDTSEVMQLIALGIAAVPLFAVPVLLKGALAAAGAIGNKLSGLQDKANRRATGSAAAGVKKRYENNSFVQGRAQRKASKQKYKQGKLAEAMADPSSASWLNRRRARMARGITGRSYSNAGDYAQESMMNSAIVEADKIYDEGVKGASLRQAGMTNKDVAVLAATGKDQSGKPLTEHEHAAAVERIMKTGSFDERRQTLEHLASNKGTTSATLRARAVQGAIGRGDQNVYGVDFANQLMSETGSINSADDLLKATVANAKGGKVSAEHLVQGAAATKYIVDAATKSKFADVDAKAKLKIAADEAEKNASTSNRVTSEIKDKFGDLV